MKNTGIKRAVSNIGALIIVLLFVCWYFFSLFASGGELNSRDLSGGYELYIEEGYSAMLVNGVYEEADGSHSVWSVTNDSIKNKIIKLCGKINGYREFKPEEFMLGSPSVINSLPRIFIDAGEFGYAIRIINWEMYEGSAWDGMAIKNELYLKPTLLVYRYALAAAEYDGGFYRYLSEVTRQGYGWYSTLTQKQIDELLPLLLTVGENNAEFYANGEIF